MRIHLAVLVALSGSVAAAPKLDPDAALRSASAGVAGTILVVESAKYPCWNAMRLLVHVEAALRPDDRSEDAAGLHWLEVRTPRTGADPACTVVSPYAGDLALIRPGTRVAAFLGRDETHDHDVDARSWAEPIVYAAAFDDLPAAADKLGPAQTMWEWLAPARPALERKGDVALDKTTGLTWQYGMAGKKVTEGEAYEYCGKLGLDGRHDWRVPSVTEVLTLAPRSKLQPAPEDLFWAWHDRKTAEPWIVSFDTAEVEDTHYDDPDPYGPYRVRCVAGHLPAARRIVVDNGFTVGKDELVDRLVELAWARKPIIAKTWSDANRACKAPWRLPTLEELRAHALHVKPEGLQDNFDGALWAGDVKDRLHDPRSLLEWSVKDSLDPDKVHAALCVQVRPRAKITATKSYPSGEPFSDGTRRYWELGQLAWDGTRSFYPDGRKASEVPRDGSATCWKDDKVIAKLTFKAGVLDGPVEIADGTASVHGIARAGVLDGKVEIDHASGKLAGGMRDGVWTSAKLSATYRAGMLDGPASRTEPDNQAAGTYVDGLHDGTWTATLGKQRGEAKLVKGTGTWQFWEGKQLTRSEPYERDQRHGELKVWDPTGKLELRVIYEHGIEREHEYIDKEERWLRTRTHETRWYASGAKKSDVERKDWIADGKATEWDEHGVVTKTAAYKHGEPDGVWREKTDRGWYVVTWRNGRIVAVPHMEK